MLSKFATISIYYVCHFSQQKFNIVHWFSKQLRFKDNLDTCFP